MNKKHMYIVAGGTINHIAPHFSICAPAYGTVGEQIYNSLISRYADDKEYKPILITTKMGGKPSAEQQILQDLAGIDKLETNDDLSKFIDYLISQPTTRGIIMAAAVCDWIPEKLQTDAKIIEEFGKNTERLKTSHFVGETGNSIHLTLGVSDKIINKIRKERKDIFLVGFKTTAGETAKNMYKAGLYSLKTNSANLVLANDIHNKLNMVITPEEYPYYFYHRLDAIDNLCDMIVARSKLTFIRTAVKDNESLVSLQELSDDNKIPQNFIPVLRFLIDNGAYKSFLGKTTGHFGCKVFGKEFKSISSVRKRDHNKVFDEGVVPIYDTELSVVLAGGAKPSVGEHTQQKIYNELGDKVHSIVHFHCELRDEYKNKFHLKGLVKEQKYFECGSKECAINTATGMKEIANIYCCHLDGHGPNIAFHKDTNPNHIIQFIEKFWDLNQKSGGNI